MRLSKTNVLSGASAPTDYNVTAGGFLSGTIDDLVNPDFSFFPSLSGTLIRINVTAKSAEFSSNYFVLHGIRYNPGGGANGKIRATLFSNSVNQGSWLINNGSSLFFTRDVANGDDWYVEFTSDEGFAIVVAVSYIRAGIYSDFPRSGVRGGEYMPFYGNNKQSTATSNQLAQPITRTLKNISKSVIMQCPDSPIEWIQDDLQDIFFSYNLDGILSVQMFDDDPRYSFAGYDLVDDIRVNPDDGDRIGFVSLQARSTL